MKKKVLLLGSTGMLGSAVYGVLHKDYDLVITARSDDKFSLLDSAYGGVSEHRKVLLDAGLVYQDFLSKKGYPGDYFLDFINKVGEVDFVINAIGITIPFSMEDQTLTFFINGALPHLLAREFGSRLIHITTDCVYDGKSGFPYNEDSQKTPIDIYGLSKSLGEPTNCLTIRTSIIGRELEGFTGLLEWFLQQDGKTINGFSEHYWNGITTKEFGKICDKIMSDPDKYPKMGLYHIFSSTVSKYEMLVKFQRKYGVNCVVNKESENRLNRTLSTTNKFNDLLGVSSFDEMIDDL